MTTVVVNNPKTVVTSIETVTEVNVLGPSTTVIVNPDPVIVIGEINPPETGYWTLEDGVTNWTLEDGTTPWETE